MVAQSGPPPLSAYAILIRTRGAHSFFNVLLVWSSCDKRAASASAGPAYQRAVGSSRLTGSAKNECDASRGGVWSLPELRGRCSGGRGRWCTDRHRNGPETSDGS